MLFTEIVFAPFLLLTLLAMRLAGRHGRAQLAVLFVASYLFYGWWDVRFLALILFSTCLDYFVGASLPSARSQRHRRALLGLSLAGNLGLLFFFKYADFFAESLQAALGGIGVDVQLTMLRVVLPVGISFYTFQSLSYTLDIYFRRLEPEPSLLRFIVYVSAFPQLVAGPIVRAREMLPQLRGDFFSRSNSAGILLIFYGLAKKLFLADTLGFALADRLFRNPNRFDAPDALLGMYGYSFQIFFDFSAYSDIAIGLGLLLGLQIPANFRRPYAATNPVEFWRRWHITLSTWFRDYLYIPLGGNRVGRARLAANLFVVMLVAGLWHGASWTFVAWGALHGFALVLYRFWRDRVPNRPAPSPLRRILYSVLFFHFVTLAWVLFRAPTFGVALQVYERLAAWSLSWKLAEPVACGALVAAIFVHAFCESRIGAWSEAFGRLRFGVQGVLIYGMLALLFLSERQGITDRLFIYFQF